jgi:hypothetical protein
MKRFDYDDEEFDENFFPDTEDEEDFDEEDYDGMVQRSEALDKMQLDLVQLDLNQRLLFKTMKMLKATKKWERASEMTKLKMIKESYLFLQQLVSVQKEDKKNA